MVTSLPLRNVAQVRARRQEDRGRELGQNVIGQVEVEIEAGKVAPFLLLDLVDVKLAGKACRPRDGSDGEAA